MVVTLAGGVETLRVGPELAGDLHLALGDQRPGDRGADKVLSLVERVGTEHREDEVLDEFLAHVVDENVLRFDAQHLGLFTSPSKALSLSHLAEESPNHPTQ